MMTAPPADDDANDTAAEAGTRPGAAEMTRAAVDRFNRACDARDVNAMMAAMTQDCVFESTAPPDGIRHQGAAAVRAAWEELFAGSPDAAFTTESLLVVGDRAVAQWRYDWGGDPPDHVRGVDLFWVRDGLIAAKVSYVKG